MFVWNNLPNRSLTKKPGIDWSGHELIYNNVPVLTLIRRYPFATTYSYNDEVMDLVQNTSMEG